MHACINICTWTISLVKFRWKNINTHKNTEINVFLPWNCEVKIHMNLVFYGSNLIQLVGPTPYQRLKKGFYTSWFNKQLYKVRAKGKVEPSRERSCGLPLHLVVVAIDKGNLRVANSISWSQFIPNLIYFLVECGSLSDFRSNAMHPFCIVRRISTIFFNTRNFQLWSQNEEVK